MENFKEEDDIVQNLDAQNEDTKVDTQFEEAQVSDADTENVNIAETEEETDKKCPRCGGVMDFNPATGNLKCPFCDYEEVIEQKVHEKERAEELDFSQAEQVANCNWGVETKTVVCKACGATSIYDALQTAAVCPFCGSNQVMEANDENTIAPGGVVLFEVTDKDAAEFFKIWIKRKWFCPKEAKESVKPQKFQGIYLPYWTFDTDTFSIYKGEYGIDHRRKNSKGETYTVTDWHHTHGDYQEFINDELVLASSNHDREMLQKLEPFDTEKNKAYKPEYIAGFVAERYSLGLQDAWPVAQASIRDALEDDIRKKIFEEHHADHVRNLRVSTNFSNVTYKYLLLPIWMSTYKYKDKVYKFMVNGQTGQVAGKTPLSVPKIVLVVIIIVFIIDILFYLSLR